MNLSAELLYHLGVDLLLKIILFASNKVFCLKMVYQLSLWADCFALSVSFLSYKTHIVTYFTWFLDN